MKSIVFITFLFLITTSLCFGQRSLTVIGTVLDSKTKKPLVNAGIGLQHQPNGTISDADGNFGLVLPNSVLDDTLFVSYVGYTSYKNRLSNLDTTRQIVMLEEVATVLDEVTILATKPFKFDTKKLEASFRIVKGNLYAASTETTNKWYNQFLSSLIRSGQKGLYEKYKPDISQYEGSLLAFFKGNPNGDGFPITAKVASYFPNDMGLFDVAGNVEEMIDEKGKACGGSWDHPPEESTIVSIHRYSRPSGTVGFRFFMDVIVK